MGSVSSRGGLNPTGSITGLTSEGIYRKSGQNSKTTSLLEALQRDARRVRLKEGEHQVDDVANTLKRFFRDLGDGLFTRRWAPDWLWATGEPWGLLGDGGRRGMGLPSSVQSICPLCGHVYMFPCARVSSGGWRVECVHTAPVQTCALARVGLSQGRQPDPPALPFWIRSLDTGDRCTQQKNRRRLRPHGAGMLWLQRAGML